MLEKLKPGSVINIDHHEKNEDKEYNKELCCFEDITDPKTLRICSTSTRTVEYLQSWELKFSLDESEQGLLAAALKLGIETDASSAKKGKRERDHDAIKYFLRAIDDSVLQELKKQTRSEIAHDAFAKANLSKEAGGWRIKVNGSYSIGCCGYLKSTDREVIREVAEEHLKLESVGVGMGFAVIGNYLEMSIRTSESSTYSAIKIAELFGGGGRPNAAGARVDLGEIISQCERDDKLLDFLTYSYIVHKLTNKE
jgi:nanoRNase/pAp phosphatase (c-di-AMP/oligoRNAs hydrolase)